MAHKVTIEEVWKGQDVYIIGGGPSINQIENLDEKLKDKKVIGCNDAYMFSCVDICLSGDKQWYDAYKDREDFKNFKGVMISCSSDAKKFDNDINYVFQQTNGISTDRMKLAFNGNTGAAAINMALLTGAKNVFLLGFDMKEDEDGNSNYHENINRVPQRKYKYYMKKMGFMYVEIQKHFPDASIYNCNLDSAIDIFPKLNLEAALNHEFEEEILPPEKLEVEDKTVTLIDLNKPMCDDTDNVDPLEEKVEGFKEYNGNPVVMTVLKSGGDFTEEHVLSLQLQIAAHTDTDYTFVCLTDFDLPDNFGIQLEEDLPGWHSKLELFRYEWGGPVTYLDLDTVITSNIDDILNHKISFGGLGDFNRPHRFASGMMQWTGDYSRILNRINGRALVGKSNWNKIWDQRLIEKELNHHSIVWTNLQKHYENRIFSYKKHDIECSGVPDTCSILCFHGTPRPWNTEMFKHFYKFGE